MSSGMSFPLSCGSGFLQRVYETFEQLGSTCGILSSDSSILNESLSGFGCVPAQVSFLEIVHPNAERHQE